MHASHKIGVLVALLGCTFVSPVFAASQAKVQAKVQVSHTKVGLFSYNYAQLSYVDLDAGFDGFKLNGSFDIRPEFALLASYMSTSNSQGLDHDLMSFGLAYHVPLVDLPKSDIMLHGEFVHASFDYSRRGSSYSNNDSGLRFGAKLRYQAQKNLELFGDLSRTSLYDGDLALTGGINLALNQQFSVVGSIELSDNDMMLLGVRMKLK